MADVGLIVDLGATLVDERDPDLAAGQTVVAGLPDGPQLLAALATIVPELRAEADRTAAQQRRADEIIDAALAASGTARTAFDEAAWELLGGDGSSYLRPLPGAAALLQGCAERGWPVVALSNTALPAELVRRLLDRHGLAAGLHAVLTSSEIGWRKPAPEAFDAALAALPETDAIVALGNDLATDVAPLVARGAEGILVGALPDPAMAGVRVVADLTELTVDALRRKAGRA